MKSMYYESLTKNLRVVESASKRGVALTRKERFDFFFKKEFKQIHWGKGTGQCLSLFNSLRDEDYRLAGFYARSFDRILSLSEVGYSYSLVKSLLKVILKDAWMMGISEEKYRAKVWDRNGVIYFKVISKSFEYNDFEIYDLDSFEESLVSMVSCIGAELEEYPIDKEFMEDYLFVELGRIREDKPCNLYVDKQTNSLGSYLRRNKSKISDSRECKIINIG